MSVLPPLPPRLTKGNTMKVSKGKKLYIKGGYDYTSRDIYFADSFWTAKYPYTLSGTLRILKTTIHYDYNYNYNSSVPLNTLRNGGLATNHISIMFLKISLPLQEPRPTLRPSLLVMPQSECV